MQTTPGNTFLCIFVLKRFVTCKEETHQESFTCPFIMADYSENRSVSKVRDIIHYKNMLQDMVAFSCCVFDGGDQEKQDMIAARERGWKGKFTKPGRVIRPGANRLNGKCPLTPLEVSINTLEPGHYSTYPRLWSILSISVTRILLYIIYPWTLLWNNQSSCANPWACE